MTESLNGWTLGDIKAWLDREGHKWSELDTHTIAIGGGWALRRTPGADAPFTGILPDRPDEPLGFRTTADLDARARIAWGPGDLHACRTCEVALRRQLEELKAEVARLKKGGGGEPDPSGEGYITFRWRLPGSADGGLPLFAANADDALRVLGWADPSVDTLEMRAEDGPWSVYERTPGPDRWVGRTKDTGTPGALIRPRTFEENKDESVIHVHLEAAGFKRSVPEQGAPQALALEFGYDESTCTAEFLGFVAGVAADQGPG